MLNEPGLQLSNLLDLGNGYSLKQLAEEARKENLTMRKLTEKSTRDAAAVKVLTIITLIYLPATVVSVSIFCESPQSGCLRPSRISSLHSSSAKSNWMAADAEPLYHLMHGFLQLFQCP